MTVRVTCRCGAKLKLKDKARGRTVHCRTCGRAGRVPVHTSAARKRTADDEPDYAAALALVDGCDGLDVRIAEEQSRLIGPRAATKVPCPVCGENIERSASRCRQCRTSFEQGSCAGCGSAIENRNRRACKCRMRTVIHGENGHDSLCRNCGRTFHEHSGWLCVLGVNEQGPCPWCSADRFLDEYQERNQPHRSPFVMTSWTGEAPGPRTDEQRVEELEDIIEKSRMKIRMIQSQKLPEDTGWSAVLFGSGAARSRIGWGLAGSLLGPMGFIMGMKFGHDAHQSRVAEYHSQLGLDVAKEDSETARKLLDRYHEATEGQYRSESPSLLSSFIAAALAIFICVLLTLCLLVLL